MGTTEEMEGKAFPSISSATHDPQGHAWVYSIAHPQGRRGSLETHRGGDPGAGVDHRLPGQSEQLGQAPHLANTTVGSS
jgi:hypothetical protein